MNSEILALEQLIKEIEMNKHDVTIRLRDITLTPIDTMSEKGAMTGSYYAEMGGRHNYFVALANKIMEQFSFKWRDVSNSYEDQYSQLLKQIEMVNSTLLPLLTEINEFYNQCYSHKNYFSSSEEGQEARNSVSFAINENRYQRVVDSLKSLSVVHAAYSVKSHPVGLLQVLQDGLDEIKNANVIYVDEYYLDQILVNLDEQLFIDHVLTNLRENIERHAFSPQKYITRHLWENVVRVAVVENNDNYIINIDNNGAPFDGRVDLVFEFGQCFGEMKNTGIGMTSARKHMRMMGGDLFFEADCTLEFPVRYVIKIMK